MNLKIDTTPRPITEEVIGDITATLREAVATGSEVIDMAGQICNALHPIRHHKKVDAHLEKVIEKHLPELAVGVAKPYGRLRLTAYWRDPGAVAIGTWGRRELVIDLANDATVQDVIDALTELPNERRQLAKAERQLACLEDLIDGEMLLREKIAEFEETRKEIATAILGTIDGPHGPYFHEVVSKHLTTLTAHC